MTSTDKSLGTSLGTQLGTDLGGPLVTLLNAPSADVFFDGGWLQGMTRNSSNAVSALLSRIGSYTVEQATGANQPAWGATSPSGRRGITFTAASPHRLVDPAAVLAGLYDGNQEYSALYVAKYAAPTTQQMLWSFGDSASSPNVISSGSAVTSGADRRIRGDGVGQTGVNGAGAAHSASIACVTEVYSGAAYSSWINGVAAITAGSGVRTATCDQFMIGGYRSSGSFGLPFGGEFYGLILSRVQWTTAERQVLERAARLYWGTP